MISVDGLSRLARSTAFLVLVGALAACAKSTPTSSDAGPPPVAAVGLDHASNDPKVVALVRPVLACPWTDKGFEAGCAALGAYRAAPDVKGPSAETTLMAMLDDPRDPVRWLAGVGLAEVPRPVHRDAERAKRLLEAARREKDSRVGTALGFALGEVDLAATKLEPEVRALVASHPLPGLRLAIVSRTLKVNPSMFEPVLALARGEQDASVRRAALNALRQAPPERKEQVSQLWVELVGDPNGEVADVAAACCVNTEALCAAHWDDVLTKMEARVASFPSFMPFALGELYEQPRATPKQKERAKKVALAVLSAKTNDDIARGKALGALGRMDPPAARKLAEKYVNEPSLVLLPIVARELLSDGGAGASDGGR